MNSREKGKRGERDFRDFLRDMGFTARRGQQFAGGADSPDVQCEELPRIHFEVKFGEDFTIGSKAVEDAWKQAVRDAGKGKMPVVAFRRNREPWRVLVMNGYGHKYIYYAPKPDIRDMLKEANDRMKEVGPKE